MPSGDKRITYALYGDAFNVKQVGCQKNERTEKQRRERGTRKKKQHNTRKPDENE